MTRQIHVYELVICQKKSFILFVYPKFINKIKITTFLVGMNIEFSKSYMEALTLLLQYKIRPDTILFYF